MCRVLVVAVVMTTHCKGGSINCCRSAIVKCMMCCDCGGGGGDGDGGVGGGGGGGVLVVGMVGKGRATKTNSYTTTTPTPQILQPSIKSIKLLVITPASITTANIITTITRPSTPPPPPPYNHHYHHHNPTNVTDCDGGGCGSGVIGD